MREAMFGTYGNEYAVYLAELSVFLIAGILIGLLVRRPFIGVNRFVTEKLEETEVL
jgi:putative membrane protein